MSAVHPEKLPELLYPLEDVRKALGIRHVAGVRSLIHGGHLRAVVLPSGQYRVTREAIDAFITWLASWRRRSESTSRTDTRPDWSSAAPSSSARGRSRRTAGYSTGRSGRRNRHEGRTRLPRAEAVPGSLDVAPGATIARGPDLRYLRFRACVARRHLRR